MAVELNQGPAAAALRLGKPSGARQCVAGIYFRRHEIASPGIAARAFEKKQM